ncbi:MAG: hypothetical protein RLZZ21_251 [Planctomycetota bacterium]|jgi:hypothetical protein
MAGEYEKLFGEVPFGIRRADDCRMIEVAEEQLVIRRIQECLEAGVSLRRIAQILREATDGR